MYNDKNRGDWRTSFARVFAATWDPLYWDQICLGTGMTISQSAGNGVLVAGTTANAETIMRSKDKFAAAGLRLTWQALLSQRVANNAFVVELVDVIGDTLAYTINSTTSVTVTLPSTIPNPFTSANVGQSVSMGAITGAAGLPGRYAIASVSGQTVTFTVASWPASGSGTLSLYGFNFHRVQYDSTVATTAQYDTGRNGWSSGNTAVTFNTSATPGHVGVMGVDDGNGYLMDQLAASSVAQQVTPRASRTMNVPDEDAQLYIQLRATNGTGAPTTTTWTIGRVAVQMFNSLPVSIDTVRPQTRQDAIPVNMLNTPAITMTSTTVAGTTAIDGGFPNPVGVGGRAANANPAAMSGNGDLVGMLATMIGAMVTKPHALPEAQVSFVAPIAGIATASDVLAFAAGAAGIRNYVTGMQLQNNSATASEFQIKDGAGTVLWRCHMVANMPLTQVAFEVPLRGSTATALNVQAVTAASVAIVNLQGYQAP